ncbi:sugar ABC transporter permease [Luedemannella helvata]|uniref:Sugar ABC transporter permease n=1 Tax=Luedemannella helvata TaxID=349315 RepID=A0ABP4VZF2_9ACTN
MATIMAARPTDTPEKRANKKRRRHLPTIYFWLLLPAAAVVAVFTLWPILRTLFLSFHELRASGEATWTGLDNYTRMIDDGDFWQAARVTVVFLVCGVLVQLVLAWTLALLLENRVARLNTVLRTVFAIPMMLSPVVIGICWRALLNPQYGWVNWLLGTKDAVWTGDPDRALWVLIAVDAWQWTPFLFLMITAGLVGIPDEIIEAARLDGAGALQVFMRIKLPLMLPVMLVGILLRAVDSTKVFELPFNLTSGGPGNATTTVAIFMYRRAFAEWDQGYASSLAVTIIAALVLFAFAFIRLLRSVEKAVS